MPPRKYALEPECSVRIAPRSPPVHDSAHATVSFLRLSVAPSVFMRAARSAYAGALAGTRAGAGALRETPPLGHTAAGDGERRLPEVIDTREDRQRDRRAEQRVHEERERQRRHREEEQRARGTARLEDRLHLPRDARAHAVPVARGP